VLLVLPISIGIRRWPQNVFVEEVGFRILQGLIGIAGLGNVGPRRPEDHCGRHTHASVTKFEHRSSGQAAAGGVTVDSNVLHREALLHKLLEYRYNLARNLLPLGPRRVCVVDRNHTQTGVRGNRPTAAQGAARGKQGVGAAVDIDEHFSVVFPALRRDLKDRYSPEVPALNSDGVALDDLLHISFGSLLAGAMDLAPSLDIIRARHRWCLRWIRQLRVDVPPTRGYGRGNKGAEVSSR